MTAASDFSLAEIGSHLKLSEEGQGLVAQHASFVIRGIDEVAKAARDQIAFVSSSKYVPAIEGSDAFVFVVSRNLISEIPAGLKSSRLLLEVPDSKVAMARVSQLFQPKEWRAAGVHPSAVVDRTVQLGREVRVGPHVTIEPGSKIGDHCILHAGVYVGRNVTIGEGTHLYPNVVLYDDTQVGARVRVHSNTVIGADGFGYAQEKTNTGVEHVKIHHMGRVVIGDDVEIGASSTIDRGTVGDTVIGKGSKIDNQVQIGHNCQLREGVIICGNTGLSGSVKVGKYAVIAGFCGIANGVEIGDTAIIGAMTGVQGNIPTGTIWAGIPARLKIEHYKIQGVLSHLPEMYKSWKRSMKEKAKGESEA